MRLASPVYDHVLLFYFFIFTSDSTIDEHFILAPILEIAVVSKKAHRTWNNAIIATGLIFSTTASSQLWFSITLHLMVTLASLEWQCQILPEQLTMPTVPLPKRDAQFCRQKWLAGREQSATCHYCCLLRFSGVSSEQHFRYLLFMYWIQRSKGASNTTQSNTTWAK